MKAKELITKLQSVDPESRVDYVFNGNVFPIGKIIDHKDGYAFLAHKAEKV